MKRTHVALKENMGHDTYMNWVIFTGSWRLTNKAVEDDVRKAARMVFDRGDGVVTGGATGVDYFAMDEFVKLDPSCTKMRVFIPARLPHYIDDYRKNWKHPPITDEDIDNLERLLQLIKQRNPASLFEVRKNQGDITQDEYDLRHNEEVTFSDKVFAFRVNKSHGTGDTVQKAEKAGLEIEQYHSYGIEE